MQPIARRQENQQIVVTGAGTGSGRAIALRLAAEGAALSLLARDEGAARGDRRARTRRARRGGARGGLRHPRRRRGRARLRQGPRGSGTVRCPGRQQRHRRAERGGGGRFGELVETNLNGTYRCLRAAQSRLTDGSSRTRHLVVISSILARIGVPGYSGYCASKAALLGLVRSLAAELAPLEVQVNAVCPGWVDTQMAREGLEGMAQAMGITFEAAHALAMQQVPLGRMGQPQDVAGLVAWLLTEDARGVTGQALDINGGAFMI